MRIFISGGTGYMGRALIARLLERGSNVTTLVRPGSEAKVPAGCHTIAGNALDDGTFAGELAGVETYVHLVGVAHPAPWKARQFRAIDLRSLEASVRAATSRGIRKFVYVSVAQPAPVMRDYQQVRAECEQTIYEAGLDAVILRPWYVLGPGHWWPYGLLPLYSAFEAIPSTRDAALRLGLLELSDMVSALVWAIESRLHGTTVLTVPDIRGLSALSLAAEDPGGIDAH